MANRIVILDPRVLMSDVSALKTLKDDNIYILDSAIDYLGDIQRESRDNEAKEVAKIVSRKLARIFSKSTDVYNKGAKYYQVNVFKYADKASSRSLDKSLIKATKELCNDNNNVTLLVQEDNLYARAVGNVPVERYSNDQVQVDELYKGYRYLSIDDDKFTELSTKGSIKNTFGLYENEFGLFSNSSVAQVKTNSFAIVGINKRGMVVKIDLDNLHLGNIGIRPKGLEQKLLAYLLMDEDIKAITVRGGAGKGKTLWALAYGLQQVKDSHITKDSYGNIINYNQILYLKSLIETDKDERTGFLPGSIEEKFMPVIAPLYASLEALNNKASEKDYENGTKKAVTGEVLYTKLSEDGLIRVQPLAYLRGMTLMNKVAILDEAQNTTRHMMKTFISRVSDSSKAIILGDDDQIDNNNLNKYNNGLAHLIESGKNEAYIAHLTLDLDSNSKRGQLSSFGANIL